MTSASKPPRKLFWITLSILAIVVFGTVYRAETQLPDAIQLNTKGQPTIGYPKARVQVVVFEEPKCSNCKTFNEQIFRKIKEEFIDSNKIKYTVIPVSFLPNSMPAAVGTLCVYYADPLYPNNDLFFTYMDYMYSHQPDEHTDWAKPDKLIQLAQSASPAINTQQLRKCIDLESYRTKIQKNTEYGKTVMGGTISTPTIYVNGIEVKDLSYDNIRKLIKEVLEHEGVY